MGSQYRSTSMMYRIGMLIGFLLMVGCWGCSSSEEAPVHGSPPEVAASPVDQPPPPPKEPEEEGPVSTGVVGYWRFDEGSGSVAGDASGGGDGVIRQASWTTGRRGGALRFSGPSSSLTVPHRPELNPPGPFEISLWVYVDRRPPGYAGLIEKGIGFQGSYRLLLLKKGTIRAAIGHTHLTLDSPEPLSLNEWHLIEMIYTGQELQLKIDGREAARRRDVGGQNLRSAYDLVIGRGLEGKIDEVKIVTHPPKAE